MMDPVMLFVVGGAIIGLLVVLTFYFFSKEEGDFEKVYNSDTLALLIEPEKKDKKGKNKGNKKDKKQQQKEQPKEQQKEEEEQTDEEETKENVQPQKVSETVAVKEVAPVTAAPLQPTKNVVASVKTEEQKEQTPKQQPSPKQDSPKENGKKKQVKTVNVKELDQKKVIARLLAISDLEEGYVQYLTTTFRDGELQKNNLSSEVKALHKKLTDSNQKVEKLQKEKTVFADREKQEQNKQATLSSKIQTLQSRESELSQAVQAAKNTLHQQQETHNKDLQALRNKIKDLEGVVASEKSNSQKLNKQLENVQTQIANAPPKVESVANESEMNQLTEKIAELEQVAREMAAAHDKKTNEYMEISRDAAKMEKAISELEESLATSRRELVAQAEREAKKDQVTKVLEAEKAVLLKEMTECQQLKTLIEGLNNDVDQFHEYKKQQENIVEDLKAREKKRIEELEAEKNQFHDKEAALQKELETERSKLVAAEKALADEKSRTVEIPRNAAAPEVVEEVFELKKTNTDLAAAPSTSTPSAELVAKLAQLEEKNEELRGRNYTLLEKTEEVPKTILKERKKVVEQFGSLAKKPFKSFDDEAAYFEWLAALATSKAAPVATCPAPAPKVTVPVAVAPATSSQDEGFYRKTVISLLAQIEHIGELVDKAENQRAQKA